MRIRFLLPLSLTLLISAAYWPIVLWAAAPHYSDGMRWIQNNPAISVFQLIFVPLIAAIISSRVSDKHLKVIVTKRRTLSIAVAAIFATICVSMVWQLSTSALNSQVIEPLEFRSLTVRQAFLNEDLRLREERRDKHAAEYCAPTLEPDAARRNSPVACYLDFTNRVFHGQRITLISAGGLVSWWQRLMTMQAALILAFLAWYLVCSGLAGKLPEPQTIEGIIIGLALGAAWFPMRLYSDWYTGFETFENFSRNLAYVCTFILFALVIVTMFFLKNAKITAKVLLAAIAALGTVFGVIAKVNPPLFSQIAWDIESIPVGIFILMDVAIFICLFAVVAFHAQQQAIKPRAPSTHASRRSRR